MEEYVSELSNHEPPFDHEGMVYREALIRAAHNKMASARKGDAALLGVSETDPSFQMSRSFVIKGVANEFVPASHRRVTLQPQARAQQVDDVRAVTLRVPIISRRPVADYELAEMFYPDSTNDFDQDGFLSNDIFVEVELGAGRFNYLLTSTGLYAYQGAQEIAPVADPEIWQHYFELDASLDPQARAADRKLEYTLSQVFETYEHVLQDNTLRRLAQE